MDPIALIRFVDGHYRPVFEAGGRQYVVGDDGRPVYGVFYIPPDDCALDVVLHVGGRPDEDF